MLTFYYSSGTKIEQREMAVHEIFSKISGHLKLPRDIVVEFKKMPGSVWAETILGRRGGNRVTINDILNEHEIKIPLIHELIHLDQQFTGRLVSLGHNIVLWEGQQYREIPLEADYLGYKNQPWEEDVDQRIAKLLILLEK